MLIFWFCLRFSFILLLACAGSVVELAPRREVVGRDEFGRGRRRGQRRLDAAADGLELLAAEGPVAEDAQVRDEAPRLRVVLASL